MNQIQSLLQRPRLYYNIDGVGELSIGLMCLGYALFAWLESHASPNSVWHQGYTWLICLAVMLSILHYGSKAIKNRITYRRTGFVAYRRHEKYWIPMGLAAAASVLLWAGLTLAVRRHWHISTPVSLIGLVLAASYIRIARSVGWKWAVFGVMVAGSLVIALLPADLVETFVNHKSTRAIPARAAGAWWLTFVLFGVLLVISGAISFWLYLRHTQPPTQEGR